MEMLGDEAKGLKGDVENLTKSVEALQERLAVYVEQLKAQTAK